MHIENPAFQSTVQYVSDVWTTIKAIHFRPSSPGIYHIPTNCVALDPGMFLLEPRGHFKPRAGPETLYYNFCIGYSPFERIPLCFYC
jgi:hypothetical protein